MSAAQNAELHPDEKIQIGRLGGKIMKTAGGIGLVALIFTVVWGVVLRDDSARRFFHSYLVGVVFFLTIALGALWFVILQHLVRAKWSVTSRRIAEILTGTFPVLGVLTAAGIILPMLLGNQSFYAWTHLAEDDHLLHGKTAFLNVPFFAVRIAIYFTAWTLLSRYFFRKSVEQDETGDPDISERLRVVAAPAMIAYAFTTAFAGFDLLMTLDPYWFSTMFGVYFWAGCALSIYAVLALIPLWLRRRGVLRHSINVEHYHDIGKYLFGFVFFWSYVAFSQFMLIWYADIPEETVWFKWRMFYDWSYVSYILLFGHFAFPFLCLLSRWTKRRLGLLTFFSAWLLVMHLVDLFWIIMPTYSQTSFDISIMDFTAVIGVGGLFLAAAAREATKVPLIPIKDPRLGDSLSFENY